MYVYPDVSVMRYVTCNCFDSGQINGLKVEFCIMYCIVQDSYLFYT
jgi:hypothetical protein